MKKREPSYTLGGNANWYSHYREQYENSLKKKQKPKNRTPYDPAIPLLGIYPEKNIIQKGTCIPMFIAPFFTIDKTWKQPEGMDAEDVVCTYYGILLSYKIE